MPLKRTTEDYLKTIYVLAQNGAVRSVQIANAMGITRASVSVTVKNLAQDGYIQRDGRDIRLTSRGMEIARATYERHQTFQAFLEDLGVAAETASADACQIEHTISAESFQALKGFIDRKLGYQDR